MTTEQKIDLSNLDVVFLLDMSGSMDTKDVRGMTRWKAGQETGIALAKEMSAHDDDGITVGVFNNSFNIVDGVTAETVGEFFNKYSPNGGTDLAPPLAAVINQFVPEKAVKPPVAAKSTGFLSGLTSLFGGSTNQAPVATAPTTSGAAKGKPVCIVVMTDGAANDRENVVATICNATKRISDRRELGILFVQIGNDRDAEAFLTQIDSDLAKSGAEHDIVARCKLEDVEDLSTAELLTLAFTA